MQEPTNDMVLNLLQETFNDRILKTEVVRNQLQIEVIGTHVYELIKFLKDDERCDFSYLVDIGGVDFLKNGDGPERFGVIYILQNMNNYLRIIIRTYISEEDLEIDSLTPLYLAANWAEREVYDMFGISFKGHPDLRRILMPDDYEGHPLRKDYPLQGRGERENFSRYEYYEPSKV
ncbi:MAG: hypothetical protein B6244_14190 [Candidatus Cloacimonetes bacterium 4572_55]|nr:MAG: hypothetical protein B6244_14190 [Candidatus Cloacimonetes bacterium 4572_55]